MVPDRIEKQTVLRAPRDRVWRAVSDAKEFGDWFGVAFDGEFRAGTRLTGRIKPTTVDPKVAELQKPYEGQAFEVAVERVEPPRGLAFHWHPFAADTRVDYSKEPMTLVTFALDEVPEGTRLTITESGFDRLPVSRRGEAYQANEGGWTHQLELIRKYLAPGASR